MIKKDEEKRQEESPTFAYAVFVCLPSVTSTNPKVASSPACDRNHPSRSVTPPMVFFSAGEEIFRVFDGVVPAHLGPGFHVEITVCRVDISTAF